MMAKCARINCMDPKDNYMAMARLYAHRSPDPNVQVGAIIVKDDKIVGAGFNCFPKGCDDPDFSWSGDRHAKDRLETKHDFVVHAEVNAIMNNLNVDMSGSTMYVTRFPCHDCARVILKSGISKVIYGYKKIEDTRSAEKMLNHLSGGAPLVNVEMFESDKTSISINLKNFEMSL